VIVLSEEVLVREMQNGNEQAFISFVDIYKRKIIGLCYSYTKDYYEAEDLSQEVFIAIYKSISKFKFESSISTYVYKIAVNKCISHKRKRSLIDFASKFMNENKTYCEDLDEKIQVKEAIRKLPVDLKNPIILYFYMGLSYKEIGDILNISERSVEGRLYRAKQKIKLNFKEVDGILWRENGTI
jgi:RNA polymerase sigma-70 factor (ECF subfamily)